MGITVSIISGNLSPIHRMVSEKFSSKYSKFNRECMAHHLLCRPAISQFLMADIYINIACKQLKIEQIAQLNQLFQLLLSVHIYGHGFYDLSRMLMRKNVNNDVSKDSPMGVNDYLEVSIYYIHFGLIYVITIPSTGYGCK